MKEAVKALVLRIDQLPEDEQDEAARFLLASLESEKRWDKLFEQTPEAIWNRFISEADEALEEGSDQSMDTLFS